LKRTFSFVLPLGPSVSDTAAEMIRFLRESSPSLETVPSRARTAELKKSMEKKVKTPDPTR
jgi:hypothetical protein